MKNWHRLAGLLAAVGLVWGGTEAAFGRTGASGRVTVLHVTGNARYSEDSHTWHPMKKGQVLRTGVLIQTAEKCMAEVLLGEGPASGTSVSLDGNRGDDLTEPAANVMRIAEDTVVGIDKLPAAGGMGGAETQLDLRTGMIIGSVGRLIGDAKYEIRIPNGIVGTRGSSRYAVSSAGAVRAATGSVVVVNLGADGNMTTKVVTAGHVYDPRTGILSEAGPIEVPALYLPVKLDGGSTPPSTTAAPSPATAPASSPSFKPVLPGRNF